TAIPAGVELTRRVSGSHCLLGACGTGSRTGQKMTNLRGSAGGELRVAHEGDVATTTCSEGHTYACVVARNHPPTACPSPRGDHSPWPFSARTRSRQSHCPVRLAAPPRSSSSRPAALRNRVPRPRPGESDVPADCHRWQLPVTFTPDHHCRSSPQSA